MDAVIVDDYKGIVGEDSCSDKWVPLDKKGHYSYAKLSRRDSSRVLRV